jgi:hypothetical protein
MVETKKAPRAEASAALQGVKGMNDLLPEEAEAYEQLEAKARSLLARWGYRNLTRRSSSRRRSSCAASAKRPTSSRRRCSPGPTR